MIEGQSKADFLRFFVSSVATTHADEREVHAIADLVERHETIIAGLKAVIQDERNAADARLQAVRDYWTQGGEVAWKRMADSGGTLLDARAATDKLLVTQGE